MIFSKIKFIKLVMGGLLLLQLTSIIGLSAPHHIPSTSELRRLVASQQAAVLDWEKREFYIINRETDFYIFDRKNVYWHSSRGIKPITFRENMDAILLFKGVLIGLEEHGFISVYDTEEREWIHLEQDAQKILATEKELIALSNNGNIWVYQGDPKTITESSAMTVAPLIMVRSSVEGGEFSRTGISGVINITRDNGEVFINFANGRTLNYSEFNLTPANLELSFNYINREPCVDCTFADGTQYSVKKLWTRKETGAFSVNFSYQIDNFWRSTSPVYNVTLRELHELGIRADSTKQNVRKIFTELILKHSKWGPRRWKLEHCRSLLTTKPVGL